MTRYRMRSDLKSRQPPARGSPIRAAQRTAYVVPTLEHTYTPHNAVALPRRYTSAVIAWCALMLPVPLESNGHANTTWNSGFNRHIKGLLEWRAISSLRCFGRYRLTWGALQRGTDSKAPARSGRDLKYAQQARLLRVPPGFGPVI